MGSTSPPLLLPQPVTPSSAQPALHTAPVTPSCPRGRPSPKPLASIPGLHALLRLSIPAPTSQASFFVKKLEWSGFLSSGYPCSTHELYPRRAQQKVTSSRFAQVLTALPCLQALFLPLPGEALVVLASLPLWARDKVPVSLGLPHAVWDTHLSALSQSKQG